MSFQTPTLHCNKFKVRHALTCLCANMYEMSRDLFMMWSPNFLLPTIFLHYRFSKAQCRIETQQPQGVWVFVAPKASRGRYPEIWTKREMSSEIGSVRVLSTKYYHGFKYVWCEVCVYLLILSVANVCVCVCGFRCHWEPC